MKKLKSFVLKYKTIIITIAIALAIAITLPQVLMSLMKKQPDSESEIIDPPGVTNSDEGVDVPKINPGEDPDKNKSETVDENSKINLDVGGDPNNRPDNNPDNAVYTNSEDSNNSGDYATQKPPSVDVKVVTPELEPKDAQPNPKPPPDEFVVVSEGFEKIPISSDKSIDMLQPEIGLLIGSNLERAEYFTLFTNAGAPRQMVEDSVKHYAYTGSVSLNPASYGLPALVGEYHIKLPVRGANVKEAAKHISDHMRNDKAFNDKVNTVFSQYKDGFISVYQKDGHFFVLFAVIDKGYIG